MLVISQSKPMALPVRAPYPIDDSIAPGYGRIDSRMSPETAGTEYKKYPNMSFLGTGDYGVAYDTGGLSDTVVKYIYDYEEVFAYQFGKKGLPGIVKVFDIQKLQKNIWAVVMEKLKPLNERDRQTVRFLRSLRNRGIDWYDYNTVESINAKVLEILKDKLPMAKIAYNFNLIPKYVEFRNNLVKAGVWESDDHPGNIGWNSDGNLVLFDLGMLGI